MSNKLTYTQTATHTNDFSLNRTAYIRASSHKTDTTENIGAFTTKRAVYQDSSQRTNLLKMKSIGSVDKTLYGNSDVNQINFHLMKTRNNGYVVPPKATT